MDEEFHSNQRNKSTVNTVVLFVLTGSIIWVLLQSQEDVYQCNQRLSHLVKTVPLLLCGKDSFNILFFWKNSSLQDQCPWWYKIFGMEGLATLMVILSILLVLHFVLIRHTALSDVFGTLLLSYACSVMLLAFLYQVGKQESKLFHHK